MKILGRTFIILFAFVLLSGLMVAVVNAVGVNQPNLNGEFGRTEFRPQGGENSGLPFPNEGRRPEGGEHGERGGGFWIFGAVKNTVVISVLVVAIVWPRSIAKKKKRVVATP